MYGHREIKQIIGLCTVCLLLSLAAAVPEYFIEEHCSQTLALNYGSVEAVSLSLAKGAKYPDGMRCAMRIQAPEGKKLLIRIQKLDVTGTQATLCQDGDYLQLFDGPTEAALPHPELPQAICKKPEVPTISTSGRFLVMRFLSNTDMMTGSGLKLLITAYTDEPCEHSHYRCRTTGQCIQSSLQCDGEYNCPDNSDESMPECLSTAAIAGIATAGVVLIAAVVIIAIVACIVHERRKRARIIKRAMSTGSFPETIWDVSKTPPIDPAFIDPIWDGETPLYDQVPYASTTELSLNGQTHETDMHRPSIASISGRVSRKESTNTINGGSDEFNQGIQVIGPVGQEMKKIPSGFWEIHLNDVISGKSSLKTPYSENPMTVL